MIKKLVYLSPECFFDVDFQILENHYFEFLGCLIVYFIINRFLLGTIKKTFSHFVDEDDRKENIIPFMLSNWDHTPRSGKYGTLLINSNPKLFKKHVS